MNWFNKLRAAQHVHGSPYKAALLALPPGLQTYWRYSAPGEFKGIRTDAFFSPALPRG